MSQKLAAYTGEYITPCDTCQVSVNYDSRQFCLRLLALSATGTIFLGRKWLQVVQLN